MAKRLYRSQKDRKIAGVAGGLGEYFEVDSTVVRLVWVVATAVTGFIPGIVAYIIFALIMPVEPQTA